MDVIIADVRSVENSLIWFERKEFPQTSPEIVNYHLDRFLKEMLMGKTFGSNFKVKGDTFNITKEAIVFTISN